MSDELVLTILKEIRREQTEQRSLLLTTVDYLRKMEQRLDQRILGVRDDLELMLKSEIMGRLTHFETQIDEKIAQKLVSPTI